jgi:RNA 3'-terminal phosphate cyclase
MEGLVEVDGGQGEGGGQVLRLAVALSAATGRPSRVVNVRANRERPGLAAQHVAAVRAVAGLCGARTRGVDVGSREVSFEPTRPPGGDIAVDVGTAGSVTLVLQAALAALAGPSAGPASVTVTGGTDVSRAPCWDYMVHVLAPALARSGMLLELVCERRGFYPVGGGRVVALVGSRDGPLMALSPHSPHTPQPAHTPHPAHSARSAHSLGSPRVRASIVWSGLPEHVPVRIDHAIRKGLVGVGVGVGVEGVGRTRVTAASPGVAAAAWADLGGAVIGSSMAGRRGLPSEEIGAALANELRSDLAAGATVDVHLLDQLVPYAALARGRSVMRVREVSSHARTALDISSLFVPLDVAVAGEGGGARAVTVGPR